MSRRGTRVGYWWESQKWRDRYIGIWIKLKCCKSWGFHGGDYEECRLLRYKNPVCTSQETHYVSATESSRLMLCKIWGFHGGDYEECRLLGYKNPVRTSQETHYVSVTESNQLMLCKIWGFHGGDYEECPLLGYKSPVHTSQETVRLHYRAQPVNAMLDLRISWRWLWKVPSSGMLHRVASHPRRRHSSTMDVVSIAIT
jgi:hypothetical protein